MEQSCGNCLNTGGVCLILNFQFWKPFHFHNSFDYVKEKGYESEPNFQRWLQARADKLRAEGKKVEIW